jgi:hypothetical protein
MIVSLNEIENLCARAALGAGLTHGLAEEAAQTAARLALAGADAATLMLRALTSAGACGLASPVLARSGSLWVPAVRPLPALLAGPAVADLQAAGEAVAVPASAVDDTIVFAAACQRTMPAPSEATEGFTAPEAAWQGLLALAARSYVKSSARSLMTGAGAGLLDAD